MPVPEDDNWFVYVLLCEDGSFYKGMTNDLYRRFYEHYTGEGAKHTRTHKPIKVIHWEQLKSQTEARQREARQREEELKSGYGRTWIKREYEKFQKYGYIPKSGLPAHQTRLMMAGKMVWNEELGKEIPEGWEAKSFTKVIKLSGGGTPDTNNRDYWNREYPFFTPADIKGKYYCISTEKSVSQLGIENSSTKLYPANTIFVTARGTVGAIAISARKMTMNQSCYALSGENPYFVHQTTINIILKLKSEAIGAVFSALVTKDFNEQFIPYPVCKTTLEKEFQEKVSPIYEIILNKIMENEKLENLSNRECSEKCVTLFLQRNSWRP